MDVKIRPGDSTATFQEQQINISDTHQSCDASTQSSGSMVCRICQLGPSDTEKELIDIGCRCKGTLSMCHKECLVAWANVQQSSTCEICQTHYPGIVSRPASRVRRHNQGEPRRIRDCFSACSSRRLWFLLICVLLFVATIISANLIHYVRSDYMASYSENVARSPVVRANYNFCFGLIMSLLVFCAILLSVVIVLWIVSECFIWPRERRAMRGHRFHLSLDPGETLEPTSARSFTAQSSVSNPTLGETPVVVTSQRLRTTSL